ncbi:hypothetical protein K432DRAFT_379022 [Lepidopterella palustris CBS 459.81]|uniref:Uncharacterized protein n=1 Tax=Lepidopterella palustris CBS 459.81 TaxID=1314670 RepID=A0A8E2EH77_9PEZI|nr:hypothetical protein K432DRAFT_379022 [Lepidopterella palustris CBS 459.81]
MPPSLTSSLALSSLSHKPFAVIVPPLVPQLGQNPQLFVPAPPTAALPIRVFLPLIPDLLLHLPLPLIALLIAIHPRTKHSNWHPELHHRAQRHLSR